MGYTAGVKGYRIYNLPSHDIFLFRDVHFHEHEFPFHHSSPDSPYTDPLPSTHTYPIPYDLPSPPTLPSSEPPSDSPPPTPPNPSSIDLPIAIRKPSRTIKPSTKLQTYHGNLLQQASSSSHSLQQHVPGITYPLSDVLDYTGLSSSHLKFILNISCHKEPESYEEAALRPEWNQAINHEIDAFERNQI
ncbi:unnamed protein product [Linum trigynum]|uniref:Retroviral polymerase SH3-like domain-containing protein n=1 Tax=Linum trigynum TaxID=586398 RepID=A0AAV2E363_9ROSI